MNSAKIMELTAIYK